MKGDPRLVVRHGVSLLTGEAITFVERVPVEERSKIVRSMLGWKQRPSVELHA